MNSSLIHSIIIVWRTIQSIHERAYNRENECTHIYRHYTVTTKAWHDQIKSTHIQGEGPKTSTLILNLQKCYVWWFINLNLKKKNGNELLGSGGGRPDGVIWYANIIRWLIGFVSNQSTNRSRTTSFNIMFSHSQSSTDKQANVVYAIDHLTASIRYMKKSTILSTRLNLDHRNLCIFLSLLKKSYDSIV